MGLHSAAFELKLNVFRSYICLVDDNVLSGETSIAMLSAVLSPAQNMSLIISQGGVMVVGNSCFVLFFGGFLELM